MEVTIHHPESDSAQMAVESIQDGQLVRRSPHVGNVNGRELTIINGMARFGGTLELELVDSIRGGDNYSLPRVVKTSQEEIPISSRSNSSKVVSACELNDRASETLSAFGIDTEEMSTVADAHIASLVDVLEPNVNVMTSSSFFANLNDTQVSALFTSVKRILVDRDLRQVMPGGKIRNLESDINISPDMVFGRGTETNQGVLLPLEAMMAVELLMAALENDGGDSPITHIAGPDMIRYTREPSVMQPATQITEATAATLGIRPDTKVEFRLPGMEQIIASDIFRKTAGDLVNKVYPLVSQYDLIKASHE